MILSFNPVVVADTQIILGDRTLGAEDFALIERAEAIILPQSCSGELYRACRESPALLFPDYAMRYDYEGKIGQSRLFEEMGWPHPPTFRWSSVEAFRLCTGKGSLLHPTPFFLKMDRSHEGDGIYLIQGVPDLEDALQDISKKGNARFVSQDVVPSEGYVLRAVLLGKKIVTYWKRPTAQGQMITTISRGSVVDETWSPELQNKGALLARRFSRDSGINLAALDFVFPLTEQAPEPLILEINYYFGRRGLGGSFRYYRLLLDAIREWLQEKGFDPERVSII
ncbi:MAG: hypothetical protein C4576_20850 [Desulfobacteraceae bacterium]|nr:MAG: hypothetical protein C4576_20850 [Desulfobacteraceae bacterium]